MNSFAVPTDIGLHFLQVDALTTKRGKEGGWVVERLLNQVKRKAKIYHIYCLLKAIPGRVWANSVFISVHFNILQLLVELDGADQRRGVFVIGATNRFLSFICFLKPPV